MNEHEQLTHFIDRLMSDERLKPVHISLSIALCHAWISSQFQCSYRVSRSILMKGSRIRSTATYHKALKVLQEYGYVRYLPSYHPCKGSEIVMLKEITHEWNDAEKLSQVRVLDISVIPCQ